MTTTPTTPAHISVRRERLRAATSLLRCDTRPRDAVADVLADSGIEQWHDTHSATTPLDARWSQPTEDVTTYLAHLSGLHVADIARTINIGDLAAATPAVVEMFELEGNLAGLVTEIGERVRSAAAMYRVARDRRAFTHADALTSAVEMSPWPGWRSTPPVYLPVGDRVRFAETGRLWWTVRAVSTNYVALVRQVPFHPDGTMQYTVIDWVCGVRGPANLIGGYGDGTYSVEQCVQMLSEFEFDPATDPARLAALARGETSWEPTHDHLEVSYRNNVTIHIVERRAARDKPARG